MTVAAPHAVAHIALSVTDLDRATSFYANALGLRQLPRPAIGLAGAWFAAGSAMIHLGLVERIPEPRDPLGHFALAVATPDVLRLTDAVSRCGGTIVRPRQTRDENGVPVTSAICCDTEGNRFELTDAGPAPL